MTKDAFWPLPTLVHFTAWMGWNFFHIYCNARENISSETTLEMEHENLQLFVSNLNSFVEMACLKRQHLIHFYAMIGTQLNHFKIHQICTVNHSHPSFCCQLNSFKNLKVCHVKLFPWKRIGGYNVSVFHKKMLLVGDFLGLPWIGKPLEEIYQSSSCVFTRVFFVNQL